jgi:hypothetical protein
MQSREKAVAARSNSSLFSSALTQFDSETGQVEVAAAEERPAEARPSRFMPNDCCGEEGAQSRLQAVRLWSGFGERQPFNFHLK